MNNNRNNRHYTASLREALAHVIYTSGGPHAADASINTDNGTIVLSKEYSYDSTAPYDSRMTSRLECALYNDSGKKVLARQDWPEAGWSLNC